MTRGSSLTPLALHARILVTQPSGIGAPNRMATTPRVHAEVAINGLEGAYVSGASRRTSHVADARVRYRAAARTADVAGDLGSGPLLLLVLQCFYLGIKHN